MAEEDEVGGCWSGLWEGDVCVGAALWLLASRPEKRKKEKNPGGGGDVSCWIDGGCCVWEKEWLGMAAGF